jgi:hypothetical protein
MTGAQRSLGFACRLTVALWLAVYLAWSASDAALSPAALPPPEVAARIQPFPEAPPEATAAAEPPPAPEAKPDPEPEPPEVRRVRARDVAAGDALLDGGGDFPALSCTYEEFQSFRHYARAMASLGARFVVVRNRQILGSIDLESGRMVEASIVGAYSPRARDYTGEPDLASFALAARGRFGRGAVVMMLVPREIDAGLFGGIAQALSDRGDRHDAYREIRGRYQRAPGGGVGLHVDSGIRRDGSQVPIDLLFDLGEIARIGGAARGSRA